MKMTRRLIFLLIILFFDNLYGLEPLDPEKFTTDEEYRNYYLSQYATSSSQLIEGTVDYAAQVNSLVAGWQSPKASEELGSDASKLLVFTIKAVEISDALAGADSVLSGLWNIHANSTATKVVFTIVDPNKNIVSNFSVPVTIAPGETKTVHASYAIRSEPGIWSVDYALVNATNDTIQVRYDVPRFAVSEHVH